MHAVIAKPMPYNFRETLFSAYLYGRSEMGTRWNFDEIRVS